MQHNTNHYILHCLVLNILHYKNKKITTNYNNSIFATFESQNFLHQSNHKNSSGFPFMIECMIPNGVQLE